MIDVTQAVRDAAADLLDELSSILDHNGIGQVADLIRDSEYDDHEAVKAFAKFEAVAYAAGVAAERKRCYQAAYGQIMSGNSRLVEINNDAVRKIRTAIAAVGGE